jgi:hypothetical protein
MSKHTCYTYFTIYGNVPREVLLSALSLTPEELEHAKDRFEIGRCRTYSVNVNDMYRRTLSRLFGKERILSDLRDRYALSYYLVAVPELVHNSEEAPPILSLEPDIVEFLYRSGTEQDLDYYIY